MILIAGLGNPGAAYAHNRHNIGFRLLDLFIAEHSLAPARTSANAILHKNSRLLALKPLTYMNNSGEAISEVARFYKPERIIILHDEMELAFARLKIQLAGSHAGHNGLKSVEKHCGKTYERIRLGIGRPERCDKSLSPSELAALNPSARAHIEPSDAPKIQRILAWVLGDFSPEQERELAANYLPHALCALNQLIASDLATTQNLFNR